MLYRTLAAALAACLVSIVAFAAAGPTDYPGIFGAGLHGSPNALMGCQGTTPDQCALGVTPHDPNGNPNDATHPVYMAPASNLADACQNPGITKSSAVINIGAAATTKIVDAVAAKKIYVCSFHLTLAGTTPTLVFKTGTHGSADCDTSAASLSGTYAPTSGLVLAQGGSGVLMTSITAGQVCGTTVGTGSSAQGILTYVQQ
jgi:hypothetical protein